MYNDKILNKNNMYSQKTTYSIQNMPSSNSVTDKKFLILVATYNERDNITELLRQIFEYTPNCNVLVVDESSPDKT